MKPKFQPPMTRREFLRTSSLGLGMMAFSHYAPAFVTQSLAAGVPLPEKDRRILVLIQLAGGNDGLNTCIPYADDAYYRLRPNLRIELSESIKLNDTLALHPNCQAMSELWKDGKMAVIQNVGYPNPNRSHFRSMEIWESGSDSDENIASGWLGRYLDSQCEGQPEGSSPDAIHTLGEVPASLIPEEPRNIFGIRPTRRAGGDEDLLSQLSSVGMSGENANYLQHTMLNALVLEDQVRAIVNRYKPNANYPGGELGNSLKQIAALIAEGMPTRVYFARLGGFDTHANQAAAHARLLGQLSRAMNAFQTDLKRKQLDDQVLTLTFSEFGRRPIENGSKGTDHGTAAPLFVMGSQLQTNLLGTAPSLDSLQPNQDLSFSTDFRQVYASVLEQWLGCDPEPILGRQFQPLNLTQPA